MRKFFIIVWLFLLVVSGAQATRATFTGVNGLGNSTYQALDRDGDGYGWGPVALINTTVAGAVSVGTQTVTPAAMTFALAGAITTNGLTAVTGITSKTIQVGMTVSGTGIQAGTTIAALPPNANNTASATKSLTLSLPATATSAPTVTLQIGIGVNTILRFGLAPYTEKVQVTSIASTTFTADFGIPHPAGSRVLDMGVIGTDADDTDPLLWTAAQGVTKYGTLVGLIQHLGYAATSKIYFISPSGTNAGTPPTCGAAAINSAAVTAALAAPCATFAYIRTALVPDDVVVLRDNLNVRFDLVSGTVGHPIIIMSYPGELAKVNATAVAGATFNGVNIANYTVDGMQLSGGSELGGGTANGASSLSFTSNVTLRHIEGIDGGSNQLGATIHYFNGMTNFLVEDSVLHDDTAGHLLYCGSREIVGDNIRFRRLIMYNAKNVGFQWNSRGTNFVLEQSIIYNTDDAAISLEGGPGGHIVRDMLVFGGGGKSMTMFSYDGKDGVGPGNPSPYSCTPGVDCCGPTRASACDCQLAPQQYGNICSYSQNNALIENNTFYFTGTSGYDGLSSSGTPGGIEVAYTTNATCLLPTCRATNFNNNTWRNNIIVSFQSPQLPVYFHSDTTGACASGAGKCQEWFATSTFANNIGYSSNGSGNQNMFLVGTPLTCAAAAAITSITGLCTMADPVFASASVAKTATPMLFDFRLMPTSPALHTGTTTGIPDYDLVGRAFTEVAPSIGALERNLYPYGWYPLAGAGISPLSIDPATGASVIPDNGDPRTTLTAAISSTSATTFTVSDPTHFFVGNLAGIESELVCISGKSGSTITVGVNSQCSGSQGAGTGRGWAGTTAVTHSNAATIYLNTLGNGPSYAQGTSPATYYPFRTQYQQAFTQGVGTDGVGRDFPGRPKMLVIGPSGGHGNYIGNELYAIMPNRATPKITRLLGPSVFAVPGFDSLGTASLNNPPLSPQLKDGTPQTVHIQANLMYNSATDKYSKFGGGLVSNGNHTYDSFEYNFLTGAWERYNSVADQGLPVPGTYDVDCRNYGTGFSSCLFTAGRQVNPVGTFGGSGFSGLNTFDPVTRTYWEWWGSINNSSLITQYYPAIHQHVLRSSGLLTPVCCSAQAGDNRVLEPNRRWIIAQLVNPILAMYKIDISGMKSPTPLAPGVEPNPAPVAFTPDSSCVTPLTTMGPGMVWHSGAGQIMLYPASLPAVSPGGPNSGGGGNTFWLMNTSDNNPANWVCTPQTISGGPAPPATSIPSISGWMQYFPSLDGVVVLNDVGTDVPRFLSLNPPDPGAGAFAINTTSFPATTIGAVYSQSLSASGGAPPYTWNIQSGALPTGLSLNTSTGAITGTSTVANTFTFTARVTDSLAATVTSGSLSITVNAAPVITTGATLPSGEATVAYSTTLVATGGTLPLGWAVTVGTLPSGLTLGAANGVISGSPLSPGIAQLFTVRVTDAAGITNSKQFSITITPAPAITTPTPLPAGTVGTVYPTLTLASSGGTPPFTWAITGGTMATGLTMSSAGVISGTPTAANSYSFTVRITDSLGAIASKTFAC